MRTTRDQLIHEGLPMAKMIARRYPNSRVDVEVEAMVALVEAANSYDPERGAAFKTWADRVVRGAILDALGTQYPVHLSKRAHNEVVAHRRAEERLMQRLGAMPTHAQIASEMGTTEEHVRRIEAYVPEVDDLGEEMGDGETTREEVTYVSPEEPDEWNYSRVVDAILESLPDPD